MLFITNRFPKGSIRTKVGRPFEFDLNNNAPSNSVFFCERNADLTITEVGGINFLSKLKTSDFRQVLLYIHGFSNLPKDVFEAAEEFQGLCSGIKDNEVLVVPVIWPCDNDLGIVQDYRGTAISAAAGSKACRGWFLIIIFACMESGRVFPEDEVRRRTIIKENK